MPQRIQRKRTKGWKMPANTVYVGRPTKWGNPWKIGDPYPYVKDVKIDADTAIYLFDAFWSGVAIEHNCRPEDWIAELRGKDLACWCPLDQPCHADILLKLANGE